MASEQPLDINDKAALVAAMRALKPGNFIAIQGNGGQLTLGCPSLDDDIVKPLDPSQSKEGDSWLD